MEKINEINPRLFSLTSFTDNSNETLLVTLILIPYKTTGKASSSGLRSPFLHVGPEQSDTFIKINYKQNSW
jgi:sulfite reductase alpha subunit-like flavoprotein